MTLVNLIIGEKTVMYDAEVHFKNLYDTVPRTYEFRETSRAGFFRMASGFSSETSGVSSV